MTINNNSNQIINKENEAMPTLKEGLSTFKVAELKDICKRLNIKKISTLKKAELIEKLSEAIPTLLSPILSEFDEKRLLFIRKIIDNNGAVSARSMEIEELEYYAKTGFMFAGVREDDVVVTIPVELLPALEKTIQEEKVLKTIKRNTEWIKITHGLLYYYGTVPSDKLVELVGKYTTIHADLLAYNQVISDAMEFYQDIYKDRYGYSYREVLEPKVILHEQAARKTIDYYPFTKKQLLEAGETGFVERPKGYHQLVSLFIQEFQLSKQEAEALVEDCIMHVKFGYQSSQLLQYIQAQLKFENFEAVQRLMDTIVPLMNHTRQWYLKGHNSLELFAQEKKALQNLPLNKGVVTNFQSEKKVGRNDPCPCGSGKKFKKCCGR